MDYNEHRDWQESTKDRTPQNMPTLAEFLIFLTERGHSLQLLASNRNVSHKPSTPKPAITKDNKRIDKRVVLKATTKTCGICSKEHATYQCEMLINQPIEDRYKILYEHKLCTNCLYFGHKNKDWRSSGCKTCGGRHNTLLHRENSSIPSGETSSVVTHYAVEQKSPLENGEMSNNKTTQVLLSTAMVYVHDHQGKRIKCRALLDPGAQSNIIAYKLFQKLNLPCVGPGTQLTGLNKSRTTTHKKTRINIESMHGNFATSAECFILPSVTEPLPQVKLDSSKFQVPKDIKLADPTYHLPGPIDILLGAGIYWKVVVGEPRNSYQSKPALQNTQLGWILGGEINTTTKNSNTACFKVTNLQLSD